MNTIEIIKGKLELLQSILEKSNNLDEKTKSDLSAQITAWRRLKEEFEFQILSPHEKQAKRIGFLASCRKVDGDCKNKLITINIYETILSSIPYIKALNASNELNLIEELCVKEMNLIDSSLTGDVRKHVSKKDIENAFKIYFEKIQNFKMKMYTECYEKIENLYNELIKLTDNS